MSEPKRTGLLELLRTSQGCQFVIPVYQRNYTWKAEEHVEQYLVDLENVLKGKYTNHFLGIIIYLERAIDFSTRELSIIDGQQRLTTTFLLIYAIKELLKSKNEEDMVQQLDGQYLTNPYHTDKIKYKLKPLVSDDDVYRCIVEDRFEDIEDSSSNVLRNYKHISNKLNVFMQRGYTLNDILMAMDKLYVVCVPISDEDNAQRIFEGINAKGVKLTSADLIRNYLLMGLQSDVQEDYYARYWRKLEAYVSADSKELEMFFRMFLSLKTYVLIPKNSVYVEFKKWIEDNELETKELFEELIIYAKIYNALLNTEIKKLDKNIQTAIVDFRKINSDLPLPAIMEFYRLYMDNKIDSEILGEILASINAYLIRRSLCDINSQNISKLFPSILRKVMDKCGGNYCNIVKVLNQEMVGNNAGTSGSYMPTDKQMYEMLHSASVYKRPALRIVLDRLELENNSAPVDLQALSIEHLMPQTPSEEWLEELETDMETYQANLHRLGNLTLATKPDNSRMGNSAWDYKNEVLRKTAHLTLNLKIIGIERWNLKHIEARTKELIEQICKAYPYPDVQVVECNDDIVDEKSSVNTCIKYGVNKIDRVCVKKNSIYTSDNETNGYIIATSKMYPQGDKEKFWFGYREKRLESLKKCSNKFLILGCRNTDTLVLRIPIDFIEARKERLNMSIDPEGNVSHYHIVIFKNTDGSVTMLLSGKQTEEIDITKYVVGRE